MMSLKCSDYLREAVHSEEDQKRLNLLSKACKLIAQVLPFKKMWITLLKQENLCKYLLLSQCLFGENIGLIITVMSEKLSVYPLYCSEFTKACHEIFQIPKPTQNTSLASPTLFKQVTQTTESNNEAPTQVPFCNIIYQNLENIQLSCLVRLRELIDYVITQPSQDQYDKCAQQIINLYKSILYVQQSQELIVQTCKDVFYIRSQWAIIRQICPYINNDIEDILMENQYKSGNVRVDGETENLYKAPMEISGTDRQDDSELSSEDEIEEESVASSRRQTSTKQKFKIEKSPPESPDIKMSSNTQRNSILMRETLIVCQIERWLQNGISTNLYHLNLIGQDIIPRIQKVSSQDSVNSSEFFKNQQNLEMILAFIFEPLRHKPSAIWQGIQEPFESNEKPKSGYGRRKINLVDIPNIKDAISKLEAPSSHYHIRSLRVLQCLTDEQNHINISKANSQYLAITFLYLNETLSKEHQSYANLNHVCFLFQFYLTRESEITFYYFLNSNLQYKFMQCLSYDQVWQFLLQLLCQMSPYQETNIMNQRLRLIDQCWNYFSACGFFGDLAQYLLNQKNASQVEIKSNPTFKTQDMIRVLDEPDFNLDETLTLQIKDKLNYTLEEIFNYKADVDIIKQVISKRYVKALQYFTNFTKYAEPKAKPKKSLSDSPVRRESVFNSKEKDPKKPETIMEMIKWAIKEASTMKFDDDESPIKQVNMVESKKLIAYFGSKEEIGPMSEARIIAKSSSIIIQKSPAKRILKTSRPLIKMKSLLDGGIDLTQSNITQFNSSMASRINIEGGKVTQSVHSAPGIKINVIYPMSLKDVSNGQMDHESQQQTYILENLMKTEAVCYNGIQLFSALINQLLSLIDNQFLRKQFCFDTLNLTAYFEIMFKNSKVNVFDCLMKIYLFKIKLTTLKKENSGILCGKLINNIISHSGQIGAYIQKQLDENIQGYVDYLTKIIIQSFEWGNQGEALQLQHVQLCSQIQNARLELSETLALLLEYNYKKSDNNQNLLVRISAPTWSTLLSLFTENRTNNIFQNIFKRIFRVAIEYGNINVYHNLFLKLNTLNYFRRVVDQAYRNKVLDINLGLDTYFLVIKQILIHLNQNLAVKTQLKAALLNIEVLENWRYLKQVFQIANHGPQLGTPQLIVTNSEKSDRFIQILSPIQPKLKQSQLLEIIPVVNNMLRRNKSTLSK